MKVELKKDIVTLDGHYDIGLDRIRDARDLCQWVAHLSSKPWMARDGISNFIRVIFESKGWELYKDI